MEPSRYCHLSAVSVILERSSIVSSRLCSSRMPCKVKKRRYGSEVNHWRSLCLVSESVCSNLLCPPSLGRGVESLNGSQRLCQRVPSDVLRLKLFRLHFYLLVLQPLWDCSQERVWAISIARLCALPHLHLRPIYVLVLNGPYVEILS